MFYHLEKIKHSDDHEIAQKPERNMKTERKRQKQKNGLMYINISKADLIDTPNLRDIIYERLTRNSVGWNIKIQAIYEDIYDDEKTYINLKSMLNLIESTNIGDNKDCIDCILTFEYASLSINCDRLFEILKTLKKHNVEVASFDGDIDFEDPIEQENYRNYLKRFPQLKKRCPV